MDINWLPKRLLYLVKAGSEGYGLNTPESDTDIRGCCVAPASYYLGLDRFEQADSPNTVNLIKDYLDSTDNTEAVVFDLKKMISLCMDNNPNMIELLFLSERSVIYKHLLMNRFLDIRDKFLSQNLKHRFSGYALQQLKRIRNHKRWIDNPPSPPTREQYGVEGINFPKDQLHACNKMIEMQVESWVVDQTHLPEDIKIQLGPETIRMVNIILEQIQIETKIDRVKEILERAANRHLGFDADFVVYLQKMKQYRSAKAEYQHYEQWKQNRNPKRAELEKKWSYDSKHAIHLVRLMRMCREALETHKINVDRTGIDREELLAIRNEGIWSYDKLVGWAEEQDKYCTDILPTCGLPRYPDRKLINQTLTEVIAEYLEKYNLGKAKYS